MSARIVDVVRKLQRLARSAPPHEAALAAARAAELQERYRVHVADEGVSDCRILIEGVAGIGWRERLLAAVGRKHRCRVFRHVEEQSKGKKKRKVQSKVSAVLVGARENVEAARDLFLYLSIEIARMAIARWAMVYVPEPEMDEFAADILGAEDAQRFDWDFLLGGRRLPTAPPPRSRARPSITEGAPVFFRIFHNAVSKALVARLDGVDGKRERSPFASTAKEDPGAESRAVLAEAKDLVEQLGYDRAAGIIRNAEVTGAQDANRIDWRRRDRLALMAVSTFPPPPPPTRFSRLEIDLDLEA